jgi:hypothetical protein
MPANAMQSVSRGQVRESEPPPMMRHGSIFAAGCCLRY